MPVSDIDGSHRPESPAERSARPVARWGREHHPLLGRARSRGISAVITALVQDEDAVGHREDPGRSLEMR